MADKIVAVAVDPAKERLRELRKKSALTPAEIKGAIEKILDHLEIE